MTEGLLLGGSPIPGQVFLGEINERMGDGGVVGDESVIEVGKTQEEVNVFDLGRGWPLHCTV